MANSFTTSFVALLISAAFSSALAQQSSVPGLKGPITQSPDGNGGLIYNIPGFDTPPGSQCSRRQQVFGRQQLESWLRYCTNDYNQHTLAVRKQWQEHRKSAGSQQEFCDNFAEHRRKIFELLTLRGKETNPLRAHDIDTQIRNINMSASAELGRLYGDGFTEFESYVFTITGLEDEGFNRIGLSGSLDCAAAPIVFEALFSNEPIEDPPNPNDMGLLSSLPAARNVLSQLNHGDQVRVSGLFRKFDIGSQSPSSISLSANPIILRIRVTALSKF